MVIHMKRLVYIPIILSVLCLIPAPAHAKLGLSLGADLGLDFYTNLECATFHPTHYTGDFCLTYAIREDWHLGGEASITKIHVFDAESATGNQHLIPLYEMGPTLSYTLWSGVNSRAGLRLRPSLRYVWGYLYDDGPIGSRQSQPRVGTYKGYNGRFAVSGYYGVLTLSLGYGFSKVKLHDIAVEQTWFGRMRLKSLDLSGPNVSVGLNLGA